VIIPSEDPTVTSRPFVRLCDPAAVTLRLHSTPLEPSSTHEIPVCFGTQFVSPVTGHSITPAEFFQCTFLSFPRPLKRSDLDTKHNIGGGTVFLIREPCTQQPASLPHFSSFESSSVTINLPHAKLSVFNIYRLPTSSTFSEPFSTFLGEFTSFLSTAATTPHKFIITSDFNIHTDNLTDHLTSQYLTVLSSFNLTQHVDFQTHNNNHILDLVITSDSSLAPFLSMSYCFPSNHFPIFTKLSVYSTPLPLSTYHSFRRIHSIDTTSFVSDLQ